EETMTRPEDVLVQQLGEVVVGQIRFRDEVTLVVAHERILQALGAAREMGFRLLTDLTAVDRYPAQPRFDVVYLLTSVEPPARMRLMVHLAADQTAPSATSLWPGAGDSGARVGISEQPAGQADARPQHGPATPRHPWGAAADPGAGGRGYPRRRAGDRVPAYRV